MGNWIREIPLKHGSLPLYSPPPLVSRHARSIIIVRRCSVSPFNSAPLLLFSKDSDRELVEFPIPISKKKKEPIHSSFREIRKLARFFSVFSNFSQDLYIVQRGFSFVVLLSLSEIGIGYGEGEGKASRGKIIWQIIIKGERKFTMLLESERAHRATFRKDESIDTKGERCWGALSKEKLWKYSEGGEEVIDSSISHSNPAGVISSGVLQWRGHRFALEQVAPVLVDTNDSPIRSLLFLRLPFRVFSLVPVSPTTIGHRWKSLRNPSHEIVSPSFLFSSFLANLKSRNLFSKVWILQVFTKVLFLFLFSFFLFFKL